MMDFENPDSVQVQDGQLFAVLDNAGQVHDCRSEVAGTDVCFVSEATGDTVVPTGLCLIA